MYNHCACIIKMMAAVSQIREEKNLSSKSRGKSSRLSRSNHQKALSQGRKLAFHIYLKVYLTCHFPDFPKQYWACKAPQCETLNHFQVNKAVKNWTNITGLLICCGIIHVISLRTGWRFLKHNLQTVIFLENSVCCCSSASFLCQSHYLIINSIQPQGQCAPALPWHY